MSRALTTLAVVATVLLGCATGGRSAIERPYDPKHEGQFQISVLNDAYVPVTVYVMNGGTRLRVGRCMGGRCHYWVSAKRSDALVQEGNVTLGWRWQMSGQRGAETLIHTIGTIPAWDNMEVVLELSTQRWVMYPGLDNRKEA